MAGVAEVALGEREHLGRTDGVHEHVPFVLSEAALADLVAPAAIPLRRPSRGEAMKLLVVRDANRRLNHPDAAALVGADGEAESASTPSRPT